MPIQLSNWPITSCTPTYHDSMINEKPQNILAPYGDRFFRMIAFEEFFGYLNCSPIESPHHHDGVKKLHSMWNVKDSIALICLANRGNISWCWLAINRRDPMLLAIALPCRIGNFICVQKVRLCWFRYGTKEGVFEEKWRVNRRNCRRLVHYSIVLKLHYDINDLYIYRSFSSYIYCFYLGANWLGFLHNKSLI